MRAIRNAVVVALIAAACGGQERGGAAPVTRDSAGVTIVENTGPQWPAGNDWRVADSAVVDISGDLDSVIGPVALSGRRLAIGAAGSQQIRIYDFTGTLLHSVGRSGAGPGEFQMMAGIWAGPGDSILVLDLLVRRLSVIDSAGVFQRTFSMGSAPGAGFVGFGGRVELAFPQGWMADGTVAGVTMSFAINQDRKGVFRDTVSAVRYASDGSARDTIARYPGVEMEQMTITIGPQTMSTPQPVPLGKSSVAAAWGDRFYLARNNSWEVEVRGLDGKVLRLIRVSTAPVPLTPELVATHRKELIEQMEGIPMLKSMPAIKSQMVTRIEQASYPATLPFITGLQVDPEGNIWVQEAQPPGIEAGVFAVLDSTGALLGRVTMPDRFRATTITADAVYGVWRDEDDLPHVRVYPLRKRP
jgi:hypothetical protein